MHNGNTTEAKHLNNRIRLTRKRLFQAYDVLAKTNYDFSVNDLYDQFDGKTVHVKTLLGIFDYHVGQIRELINKEYSLATLSKFILVRCHVKDFIKAYYSLTDYPLSQLSWVSFVTLITS